MTVFYHKLHWYQACTGIPWTYEDVHLIEGLGGLRVNMLYRMTK